MIIKITRATKMRRTTVREKKDFMALMTVRKVESSTSPAAKREMVVMTSSP